MYEGIKRIKNFIKREIKRKWVEDQRKRYETQILM